MEDVYIVGAARTPMGGMQGALADAPASSWAVVRSQRRLQLAMLHRMM